MAMPESYPPELQLDSRRSHLETSLWIAGTAKNMYANRVSFSFDLRGPSMVVDTACSSSLVAFDLAVTDIRLGKCDMAIVGATQLNLQPFTNWIFQNNHFNAPDGVSKVWDKDADGFVRAETIGCILLQKKPEAKRIYCTVVHSKTNIDGYKKSGNFFPSKDSQQRLLEEACVEANVDPNEIDYFEAHGTGTRAGDPEEAKAIAGAYCRNRQKPLLIGLLKSNIGHGEGTSGLASIAKTIVSFENKLIAANLNLKVIKPEIARFCPPLVPVNENTPFEPKYCGVNSFGLGGVNGHAILLANKKELSPDAHLIADKIPRLVNYCGRTQESIDYMFDFIQNNPQKVTRDFLGLLDDTAKFEPNMNTAGFPYRASLLIKQKGFNEDGTPAYEYSRETNTIIGLRKSVWFFFSGMGSQWVGMAKSLMIIDKFAESIHRCAEVLKPFKVDLLHILLSDDENALNSIVNPFIAITAVQIALFDVLTDVGIQPEGIIGHSFGEIACAYADGCMTLEQTMLCSYWRGKVVEDSNIPKGKMAAVGLSWEEAVKRCPKNVYVACDNAYDSVTISGLEEDTTKFLEKLKADGVFVRDIVGYNLKPYHSVQLKPVADILTKILNKVIPEPKERSVKWASTSVPEAEWFDDSAKYASAEYFVNNLIKPVLFTSALRNAPADATFIEIAPHALFASLIKRTLDRTSYVGLMKRNNNDNNLEMFISALGKIYQLGINPTIENLYPKVQWPVARGTQSISSLMKWDHSETYFIKRYPQHYFPATASDMTFNFDTTEPDDQFLCDHTVEGRTLFPATGYLMLAWRRLAAQRGQQWNQFPVVFENVKFMRPVQFEKSKARLIVRYNDPTGEFVVLDNGNIACYGKVFAIKEETGLQLQHKLDQLKQYEDLHNDLKLNTPEFYRELKIRGYDYGPKFQGVVESKWIDINTSIGKVRFANTTNFIAFLDTMLQLLVSVIPISALFIPVALQSFKCDPLAFYEGIEQSKTLILKDEEEAKAKVEKIETVPAQFTGNELYNEEKEALKHDDEVKEEFDTYKEDIEGMLDDFQEKTGGGKQKWIVDVPVVIDMRLRALIAKGIEARGLIPVNVPRKFLSKELRLEKYQFIPYHEENAIEQYNRNELTQYLNVCTALCKQILTHAKFDYVSTDQFVDELRDFHCDSKLIEEMTLNIPEDQTMLNSLNYLYKNQFDDNKNLVDPNELMDGLRGNMEKLEFDLTKDIINLVGRNERMIRPFIDTVNENVTPIKECKVLEINPTNGIIGVDISVMQTETFIVPIGVGYTLAHKDAERIKGLKELNSIGDCNVVEWSHFNTDFPENVKDQVNLIIHRDTFDLWTVDLGEYFNSALKVLKENGFVLAVFRSKITKPEIILNELLENQPFPSETELLERIDSYEKAALEKGFKLISKKTDSMLFTALLFRKINTNIKPSQQTVLEIKTGQYESWLEQLKQLIQEHKLKTENELIWLHANDSNINGVIGLTQCLRMESGGDKLRYIFDADNRLPKKVDFEKSPFKEILESNLVMNVFRDGDYGAMKHLTLPKDDDQVETDHAYVNVMQRGDLSSMQFFDGRNLSNPFMSSKIKTEQSVVDIYYSSLNFKDIMIGTGRLATGPEGALIDCMLGCEFAGRRRDTGERVFGMPLCFGIGTETKTHEPLIYKVPDHWTLEDAATACTVYMTCWYGLIERGQLQEGESILIHSGTGGIGQAAINICQYYKCKIFVTVSTQEKRDFLKKNYGLTDDQMFNSRDTNFEKEIMKATDGQGVDLVLNSLAEDKLLASFRCVGDDGRFIEIGKYDFQMNNPLPMFAFIRNITFHGVALDKVSYLQKKVHLDILKKFEPWLYDGIKKGFVKPFHRTVFGLHDSKEAFKYMMTGKHIGKVVIKIRDEEPEKQVIAKPMTLKATAKTWFHSDKVYIIIGGLGGMGIEIVYWMMLRGATKVLLTSRTGIKANPQRLFFRQLEELGKQMERLKIQAKISTQNAIYEDQAEQMIKEAEEMGKIGGIFQLAVVLHDALFENQTIETFNDVCKPKVDATINLDKLTRKLPYKVDYFVTFSSITCGRGNTGQSPYGYANSVMERICENRRKDGHHGLAIQWGPIGDVGVLADTFDEERIKIAGLILQRLPSWLYALDRYLQCKHPVVASLIRMDKQLRSSTAEENIMKQLWMSLGVDPKTVPNDVMLGELGMESFVAVELQQRLERDYDIMLTINEIKRCTIGELKEFGNGNKEAIKQYAADIKLARINIAKLKFEMATEQVTKLNDATQGKPLYFLPPVEGMYSNLLPLAQLLPFPVYGLNWTYDCERFSDIKEVTKYYTELLKTLEPKGDYHLLTTSFGSAVALKMCHKKVPIKKLYVIDAFSMDAMVMDAESELNQSFDQCLRFVNRNVPKTFQERIKKEIYKTKGGDEEKAKRLVQSLKDMAGGLNHAKDIDTIIHGAVKKGRMVNEYRKKILRKYKAAKESGGIKAKLASDQLRRRIKSELIIIKSSETQEEKEEVEQKLFDTYGLHKEVNLITI